MKKVAIPNGDIFAKPQGLGAGKGMCVRPPSHSREGSDLTFPTHSLSADSSGTGELAMAENSSVAELLSGRRSASAELSESLFELPSDGSELAKELSQWLSDSLPASMPFSDLAADVWPDALPALAPPPVDADAFEWPEVDPETWQIVPRAACPPHVEADALMLEAGEAAADDEITLADGLGSGALLSPLALEEPEVRSEVRPRASSRKRVTPTAAAAAAGQTSNSSLALGVRKTVTTKAARPSPPRVVSTGAARLSNRQRAQRINELLDRAEVAAHPQLAFLKERGHGGAKGKGKTGAVAAAGGAASLAMATRLPDVKGYEERGGSEARNKARTSMQQKVRTKF